MLGPKAPLEKLVMTPAEVERTLPGFSKHRIKEGMKSGQIPTVTFGKEPMIPRVWVENMLEELTTPRKAAPVAAARPQPSDPTEALRALAAECAP
jgi:hypothetical protein